LQSKQQTILALLECVQRQQSSLIASVLTIEVHSFPLPLFLICPYDMGVKQLTIKIKTTPN